MYCRVTAKTTSAMVLGLGMVVDLTTEGLIRVVECFISGAADTAGVRVGDIILAIDDHDLIKRKSFREWYPARCLFGLFEYAALVALA